MKTTLIEVGLLTNKLTEVQPALETCLRETGDALIGHQVYDDLTLLVVRLLSDTIQCHLDTLSTALRLELIDSFQVIHCQLFKVVFKQKSATASLKDFPLHISESWFAAAEEENTAYLCLTSPHLSQAQISWLATQPAIALWTQVSLNL
jgi:hypothetical protein